jgi:putative acetyltransferase
MNFTIHKSSLENIDEILELFKNTIKNSCSKDYNETQITTWISSTEDKERWKHKIRTQYFIVAKLHNKIVGFGSLEENYIDLLYVHEGFLNKGIASLIYQSLKTKSANLGFTSLSTHSSITAVPFFKSKKFEVIKENKVMIKGVEIINFEMTQN